MDVAPEELDFAEVLAHQVLDRVRQRQENCTATYRLQLHAGFTFRDAARIVPYLAELGISHIYCSPYLRARTGSQHGYDICDHGELNPELGGIDAFLEFTAALKQHGLGHILDVVPNHMAASLENPWWFDVLENGPVSPYSRFFDVDWQPVKHELENKILLPVLGQHYGEALEDGQLQLEFREGSFYIHYFDRAFPLGPKTTIPLLKNHLTELHQSVGSEDAQVIELESIITALDHLPPQAARDWDSIRERQREKAVIKRRLNELVSGSEVIRGHLERNIAEHMGEAGKPESWDRLDQLLDGQPYRLSHWRAAADEINYRRFFDVNELAAICMELPEVFHAAHALLRPLIADGTIHGLRIDHVDGLYDPEQYLWRLQWAYLADLGEAIYAQTIEAESESPVPWRDIGARVVRIVARELGMRLPQTDDLRALLSVDRNWSPPETTEELKPRTAQGNSAAPLFVLVEKILGPDEPLPESWPVAGTSGYDFLNMLGGLFLDAGGYEEIGKAYQRFLDEPTDLGEVEHTSKLLILRTSMSSELQMLAHRLNRISEQHRRSRDYTLNNLRLAIREVLACFPVYRIYPGREGISERDRRSVNLAVVRAKRRNPAFDPAVFEFLRSVLLLSHPAGLSAEQIAEREIFTGKFQQVTSPVMAKGVEDTAFYVHVPLLSLNEVGNDPRRAVTSLGEFHESNRHRQQHWRQAMLATSTHDTKRSEDVRARLHVLSEVPQLWRTSLSRMARANQKLVRVIDDQVTPSRNDQYLFYQSLLGIWPVTPPTAEERQQLIERLTQYMEKATREAKQRTNWNNPSEEYDAAVRSFVTDALRDSPRNKCVKQLEETVAAVAAAGYYSSLSQLALKLLCPGTPDIYQGQELWDFSLVDPDNRRPVDYAHRQALLSELWSWDHDDAETRRGKVVALGRSCADPRLKLLVVNRLLQLRKQRPSLFREGHYLPLETIGTHSRQLVAFGWSAASDEPLDLIAVIPRQLFALISPTRDESLWKDTVWQDTTIALPENSTGLYRCLFTERTMTPSAGNLAVASLLDQFPLTLLVRNTESV